MADPDGNEFCVLSGRVDSADQWPADGRGDQSRLSCQVTPNGSPTQPKHVLNP